MRANLPVSNHSQTRILKYFVSFVLLAICIWLSVRKVNFSGWPVNDYSAYWAASRLLIAGQNPYDSDSVLALQKAVGSQHAGPLVMRNPPWALPLVLPLALFSLTTGRILWLSISILSLIVSAMWLWKLYGGQGSRRWIAWLVGLSFMPGLWVLAMGQITPLILLGVIGFLYCESNRRSNTWLQAAALVLIALKPQLLYLFWIALFLQVCLQSRRNKIAPVLQIDWSLPLKFIALLLAMTALPILFDSQVCAQYLGYLRQTPILQEPIPTFGNLLRIHTHIGWAQFAPMFLGGGWVIWRSFRQRNHWNWSKEMPLLLMASLLTTPYCWFYDQVVLLPAILYVLAQNSSSSKRVKIVSALALYFAVDLTVFGIHYYAERFTDVGFALMAPAWLFLYVALRWLAEDRNPENSRAGLDSMKSAEGRIRLMKYVACFALLGVACWLSVRKMDLSKALVSDYAAYWSAGHLLITGKNPYDPVKVFALEKTVGRVPVPLVMRNPPWAFGVVLPFGFLSYKLSRVLWTLPEILALILCASWMWKRHTRAASSRWVAWLVASTFIPALWVLIMGQITPFILLGVVGFLFCESTDRANSWLQAACLVLVALKPQLLYLFWFALMLSAVWALRDLNRPTRELRRWSLFLKFGVLLIAFSAVALIFNPRVFADYFTYLRNTPILLEVIPTFGNLLRMQTNLPWTQFAPMFLGCGWALWRWVKMRDNWNWEEQMPALLLASVLTTTYSWFYDQIVLLPALLYAAAQNFPSRNRIHSASVVALFLAVNAGVTTLFVQGQKLTNFNLLWSTPAWCALFVAMQWLAKKRKQEVLDQAPVKPAEAEEPVGYASNLAA
jgi:hypothetical protein